MSRRLAVRFAAVGGRNHDEAAVLLPDCSVSGPRTADYPKYRSIDAMNVFTSIGFEM